MEILSSIAISLAICVGVQICFWLIYLRTDNAAIVDVAWALTLWLGPLSYWFFAPEHSLYSDAFFVLLSLWSLRMTLYLFLRYYNSPEDGRYLQIRKEWSDPSIKSVVPGRTMHQKFLSFFIIQALISWVLTAAFAGVFLSTHQPEWNLAHCFIFGVILLSICAETLADFQLYRFKKDPKNHGLLLNTGLWKYSRHPNYFFEICNWIGFAVWASFVCSGLWAWLSPLIIGFFILKVTGVPATDAHNAKSKSEHWPSYLAKTNALFPFFKLKARASE